MVVRNDSATPRGTGSGRTPTRLPIFLSGLVYPGAGQIMQRRWLPALLFAGGFTVAFIVFLVCFFRIIMQFYGLAFDPGAPAQPPKLAGLLIAFGLALAVYAVSLIDTYSAYARERRRHARARLNLPPTLLP